MPTLLLIPTLLLHESFRVEAEKGLVGETRKCAKMIEIEVLDALVRLEPNIEAKPIDIALRHGNDKGSM